MKSLPFLWIKLSRLLDHLIEKRSKHRLRVVAPVVAEAVLVQVRLEIRGAYRGVDAAAPALDECPESFHCVRVNNSRNVDFLAVLDAPMRVSSLHAPDAVVTFPLIGKDRRCGQYMLPNDGKKRGTFCVCR